LGNWEKKMKNKRFIYYKEDAMWVGWLEDYPDYRTQGETLDELKENLKDIYEEITSGNIPSPHMVGELVVG
jgi:predicted RNase H-like HicB family nuclease